MKKICTAISTKEFRPSHISRPCSVPPHYALAAGEAEEREEAGEGGDEVGGGNVVRGETYVMAGKNGGYALNSEKDACQGNECLDAIVVGGLQYEWTEEMAYAVEEQSTESGEHLIGVAEAMGCGNEG